MNTGRATDAEEATESRAPSLLVLVNLRACWQSDMRSHAGAWERIWTPHAWQQNFTAYEKIAWFTYIRSLLWEAIPDLNGIIHRLTRLLIEVVAFNAVVPIRFHLA